jgi:hypothetical protein
LDTIFRKSIANVSDLNKVGKRENR